VSGVVTRLLLVRHGQSTWNAEERWQGHADPPLSELGQRQARAAAKAAAALAPAALFSSDLTRARQTAELLAPPGMQPTVEPALRERDVGEWTGLTRTEIEARYPGYLEAQKGPPSFESNESLLARTLPALEAIAHRLGANDVCVIVTHGGVIRTIERGLGGVPAPVPNLAGRWVHGTDDGLSLGDREVLVDPEDDVLTVPQEE
jgi:broad specificity phosphatase PhoE